MIPWLSAQHGAALPGEAAGEVSACNIEFLRSLVPPWDRGVVDDRVTREWADYGAYRRGGGIFAPVIVTSVYGDAAALEVIPLLPAVESV